MSPTPDRPCRAKGLTRRGFLLGAGAGLAVGGPLGWLGMQGWQQLHGREPATGVPIEAPAGLRSLEGALRRRLRGQVVEVRHPGSVSDDHVINRDVVRHMVARGMCELTGADHAADAWRAFFCRDDVVGIKVNPVGRRGNAGGRPVVESISSPALLLEVVEALKGAGVPPRNLLVFERYANEFRDAGYERVMRERGMEGVRWFASSSGYDETQLAIDGLGAGRARDPHVVGYDRDVFVSMGFCQREHDPRDDRRFRSHLSAIVTRMVNKIVNLPCLKDHRSAGVTLSLKNMSML